MNNSKYKHLINCQIIQILGVNNISVWNTQLNPDRTYGEQCGYAFITEEGLENGTGDLEVLFPAGENKE